MFIVLLIVHVLGAVFLVGPLAILPMLGLREIRNGRAEGVAAIARSTRLFAFLSILVLVIGFGLLSTSHDRHPATIATPWVAASVIIFVAAVSLILLVTVPSLVFEARRLAAPAAEPSASSTPAYRRVAASSGAAALGLVAITVLMVWQP